MRLIELGIQAFGGLRDRRLHFVPGLNLVYGPNEQGKSTVMACLRAMFFGLGGRSRGIRDNDRRRYMPWAGGQAGAAIVFEHKGRCYRLERTFGERKAGDTMTLMDNGSGRIIPIPTGAEPGSALLGVSEEEFLQTVFVEQLSSPVHEPDDAVLSRLANLSSTGEEHVSYGEVDERLRRAQVRLRAERGGGGLLQAWAAERSALEERLEAAVLVEKEQASRLEQLLMQETAVYEAEAAAAGARLHRERLEAVDAAVRSARDDCLDAEREEQALLEEMELWEKGWEQECSMRDDAAYETNARQARLEDEISRWQSIRADALAEADREVNPASPRGNRRTLAIVLAVIAVFLLAGLSMGLLVDPAYFAVAVAALAPAAAMAASAAARRREAASQAEHRASVLLRAEEASRQADMLFADLESQAVETAADLSRRQARFDDLDRRRLLLEDSLRSQSPIARCARDKLVAAEAGFALESAGETLASLLELERDSTASAASLREKAVRLDADIRHAPRDPEGIDSLDAHIRELVRRIDEGTAMHACLTMAREGYREAFEALQNDFGPRLNARAASLLSGLTEGRYAGLKADRNFNARISDPSESSYRSWEYLSGGTVDQVYLALRIAVAETISPDDGLPLLLDDVFVQYDDARAMAGLRVLASRPCQVLLFHCHQRITDFAATLGLESNIGKVSL